MLYLLQWLGGGGYLLQKVFLAFSERARNRSFELSAKKWRIAAWVAYLVGLPPIVMLFALKHNWIAGLVEASGAPSMVLGLVGAIRGVDKKSPRWLDWLAVVCAAAGFAISLWDFGGLTTLTQWLEIGVVCGFLAGTYLLAKQRSSGYPWYVLMHASCGWLMWQQDLRLMVYQQIISLGFTLYAWYMARRPITHGGTRQCRE